MQLELSKTLAMTISGPLSLPGVDYSHRVLPLFSFRVDS